MERMPEESRRRPSEINLRGAQLFVFVSRVNEYHASYFIGVKAAVYARIQTANGRTSEDVWRRYTCSFQELMEIIGNRHTGSREGARIAPTLASAVVPACLSELGNFRLEGLPSETGAGSARLEDNRWRTCSRTENIKTPATNVH
jgi:hypothetical protein